jgi:hypothetical protein
VVNPRTDDELNIRWLQLGAVSGVMRTQANGFSFRDNRAERSQVWHPAVLPIWRRYAKLRTQLQPYLRAASRTYQRTGLPIVRHLALTHPEDPEAVAQQTEFMFGPDLLAAPVIEPGAVERSLYLPRGRWVDLWRSVSYRSKRGALRPRRARLLKGGREVTIPAPLEELPLLAKAGTILPMLPSGVDTLAPEGNGPGLVHAGDRRRRLVLLAFPRGRSRAALGDAGAVRSRERHGSWALRVRSNRERRFRLRAGLRSLRHPFRPCAVELDGEPLEARDWSYFPRRRALAADFRARAGTLVVRSC